MSGRKFCRICLNEVSTVSKNMYSSNIEIKQILMNIFPGMNTSLTSSVRLCEECFNNVNFANQVKKAFIEKEEEFTRSNYKFSSRPYCGLCFRFETPGVMFLNKDNYSSTILKGVIEIALSEFKITDAASSFCGICWSWVKKIYSFKKRCFKMEEILKAFCSRNKLVTLTDKCLEEFVFEQYCIRTGRIYPSKQNNVNIISDIAVHQKHFQITGQIYSNVSGETLHYLEAADRHENVTNNLTEECDLKDIEVTCEDSVLQNSEAKEVETEYNLPAETDIVVITNGYEKEVIDIDDEFNEVDERRTITSDIIILDDDDDDEGHDSCSSPILSTKGGICIEESRLDEPKKADLHIHTESNIANTGEDLLPKYFILNSKKPEYLKKKLTEPGDANSNHFIEATDINTKLVDSCANNITTNSNNTRLPESNTSCEHTVEISKRLEKCTEDTRKIVYCGTPQFTKIYQRYVNLIMETDSQIEEDQNSYCEAIILSDQDNSIGTSTFPEVNSAQSKDSGINQIIINIDERSNYYESGNDGHLAVKKITEYFVEENVDDCLIVPDEDCFEIVSERDNVIDITNVESYIEESQIIDQRNTCTSGQKNEFWGCYICIAKFNERSTARKHMLSHENPWNKYGRFQCRKCPYRANWKGSLTRHQTLHTKASFAKFFGKKVIYFCPFCSNIYHVRGNIQAHINEHVMSWKSYQCGDCMYNTNKSETLWLHYSKYHCIAKDPNFKTTVNWEAEYGI